MVCLVVIILAFNFDDMCSNFGIVKKLSLTKWLKL